MYSLLSRSGGLRISISLLLTLALLNLASPVHAVDFTWTGTVSSDWAVNGNWTTTAPSPTGGGTASPQPWRINVNNTPNTLVYSAAQGHTVLSGGGSNRSLFIANGTNLNGTMSITGGIFESTSTAADAMVNGDSNVGTLSIDGGTYRKITTTAGAAQGTFGVRLNGTGTSRAILDINSGSFEVMTLDLQNGTSAGNSSTLAAGIPETLVNLDGGTLSVGGIVRTTTSTGVDAVLNFNGGTLQARQSTASFLNALSQVTAVVQAGGAVMDTQAFDITIAAPLVHDTALGATPDGGLTKIGTGTLTVSGTNTFTGGTFIKNGTLALAGGNDRLATTTMVTLGDSVTNDSGVLRLDGNSQTVAGLQTTGAGANNRVVNGSATAATLTVNVADANTFNGSLGGPGVNEDNFAVTKAGAGTLVLSGVNTYTGVTTVSAGTLQFAKQVSLYNNNTANWTDANLIVNSGATAAFNVGGIGEFTAADIDILKGLGTAITGFRSGSALGLDTTNAAGGEFIYAGAIANPNGNALGLTKLGTGTLTLSGANTHTGPTTVNSGTLKAGAANVLGTNSTVTLANAAGVTLDLNGFSQSIGALAGGGATGGEVMLGGGTLTLGGGNASGAFAGVISGAGGVTKTGTGTQTFSGANTYSGTTSVNQGTLLVAHNSALGTTGAGNNTTVASGAGVTLANGVTVTGESIGIAGAGVASFGALQAIAGGTAEWAGNVTIEVAGARLGAQAGGTLIVSGNVSNGAAGTLAISGEGGTGTVILSSTGNTYTGSTQIIRGVLKLGATNALPGGTVLDVDNTSANENATFDLNGFNQSVSGLQRSGTGSGAGGSFITNSGTAASTLTVNQGSNTSYSGIIQDGTGVVHLTKTGTGSLALSGANSYSGLTSLSGTNSEIVANHNSALGNTVGGTTVASGARLTLGNGVTVTGETLTMTGSGGNNNGALQTSNNAVAEWAGNIIVNGTDARIGAGAGGTLTISGAISGTIPILFSRADNATTILNGVSTYTGDTQLFNNGGAGVTGSTLRIGVDNAINAGSRLSAISTLATKSVTLDLNGHVLALRSLDTSASHASGAVFFVANHALGTTSVLTLADPSSAGSANAVFAGILQDGASGTGGLSLVKSGGFLQILIGNNTYTGSTTVNSGTLQVGGAFTTFGVNGAMASTAINLNGGIFAIDNLGANNSNNNRLADAANLTFNGGALIYRGSDQASTNSSETIGNITIAGGFRTFTVAFGSTNTATVNANQITRPAQGGILLVNGTNLGAPGTSSVSRIFFNVAPDLVGGSTGGNVGLKDMKIVPFLVGEATASSGGNGTATGTANTFLTYDPATGLRPLNPLDEFTQNSFVANENIRLTNVTPTVLSTSTAINSLLLAGGGATVASGQTLTVNSGAILFASGTGLTLGGTGTLNFGGREGIVTINSSGNTTINTLIAGTAGVSYYGTGTLVLGTQQSTYSGDTRLQVGLVIPQGSSIGPAGAPVSGPFGTGNLILAGSSMRATTSTAITIGNNVQLAANTSFVSSGTAANDKVLTFTGAVTITGGDRTLTQSSGANTLFTGNIGDGGNNLGLNITGTASSAIVTTGANTYGGATNIGGTSTLMVNGSHTGAGTYTVSSGATLTGGGAITTKAGSSVSIGAGGILSIGNGTASATDLIVTTSGGGALTFASNTSILRLDIWSDASPGTGSDQTGDSTRADKLMVVGDADLNGARLIVGDPNNIGISFSLGDTWDLFDWSTTPDGTFTINASDLPTLGAGLSWDTSDLLVGGSITVVPEPSRVLLLVFAGLATVMRRRRRKAD
jgi:fibronectin-binding autotransporter adhesin